MNIVLFNLSSSGIAEDISKRKPINIIGNPRRKHYTRKNLIDELCAISNAMCSLAHNAILANKWTGVTRRKYLHLANRSRALRYAKHLKDA